MSCCGGSTSFGSCGKVLVAACASDSAKGFSSCGKSKSSNCCCNSCTTSLSILKNTVNPRDCCPSDKAHLYAYNVETFLLAPGATVPFSTVGASSRVVPPGSAGNTATQTRILFPGVYLVDFYVRGVTMTAEGASGDPLVFQLLLNGAPVPGTQFASQDKEVSGEENELNHFVVAHPLVNIPSNTVIEVQNITGLNASSVQLISVPTGGPPGSDLAVNASLRVIRMC